MFKKNLISILSVFFISFTFFQPIVFAELDMQHNIKEDFYLRFNNWYIGHCRNGKKTCIKNLIRYESAVELEDFLIDLEKSAEDEKEEAFWRNLTEKVFVGMGGIASVAAGLYFAPITTVLTTGGFIVIGSVVYHIHDNVIEPVGKTAGFFVNAFIRIKDWILGRKKPREPDKGLFGNAESTLFGDKSKENVNEGLLEAVRKLIFGDKYVVILTKDQKKAFVNKIREKFHQLIKNKEWLNNDIIVLSVDIDPKVMQSDIKFDRVNFDLNYKKDLKNYFKKIKV